MVLPSGFALPPLPYVVGLLIAGAAVAAALLWHDPSVTEAVIAAFAPWMAAGAAAHALYQLDAAPAAVRPLLGVPAVYATTLVVACGVWVAILHAGDRVPRRLAAAGTVAAVVPAALVLRTGTARGSLSLVFPAAGLAAAAVLSVVAVAVLRRWRQSVVDRTGAVGALVIFGHALDGTSTAIGVDLLGAGERTPLPRIIMDFAGSLPTAEFLGVGWLFVLVKLAVALVVLVFFADYVREKPAEGYFSLGIIAAVGLGPGVQNLLLFAVVG